MKKHIQRYIRPAAFVLCLSLLLSTAGCGQSPAETPAQTKASESLEQPSSSETKEAPTFAETKESSTSSETKDEPSPGTVKAGNLIEGIDPEPVEGKDPDDAFTASQYSFAAELLRRSYEADGGNCLISPLSIVLALAMTANGADGETLRQMLEVLGGGMTMDDLNAYLNAYVKSLPSSSQAKLAVADSIWLNDRDDFSVLNDFLRKTVSWYGADVYKLPFDDSAVREVNGWVSRNTDQMIERIIDKLNDDDRMLLINAICFDAKWEQPYSDYSVQDAEFTRADGSKQTVQMMYSQEHTYYEGEDFTGFAKYYEGRQYKFVAILPDADTSLDDFMAGMTGEKLAAILGSASYPKVNAGLPKFSYEYSAGLKERLQDMGIVNAFVDDPYAPDFADFSLMSETNPLYISEVIHKTFIDVMEGGTRAAAVTVVEMAQATAMPTEPPKQVILDRPFLYMIVDNTNDLPIFIGTVNSID